MFNNKTLEKIYNDYIKKTPKFKSNYKFSFWQKLGLFIPILSLYNIFKIRKNLSNEIKRAEKELQKEIPFNLDNNCLFSDSLTLIYHLITNTFFIVGLLFMFNSLVLGGIITFSAVGILFIYHLYALLICCNVTPEKIEEMISEAKDNVSPTLSKEDMIIINQIKDSKILESFLVKNDLNITYNDLKKIDKEIEELENQKIKRKKAKEILLSLSSEASPEQALKEEELKYV